jgi:RND family efflux transporter MFP subunit
VRALAALMPLLLLAACKDETPPMPPRPVLAAPVEVVSSEVFGPFASTLEARYQTQLGFQLSGRMVARDVYVGDLVRSGQRLAALDPTVIQFALTRAKADVVDAKAQLANAEGVQERQRLLAQAGNASQATLDNAVAAHDTAQARLDQAAAALRLAEEQIGYTELHANFDGVITAWTAEVGQYVTNGQAVVTVARPDIREAVVDIPDELIGQVHAGLAFTVRLQTTTKVTATARVREIGPAADTATRSHRVRLTLEAPPDAFRIGTTVSVAIEHNVTPRLLVPAQAVVETHGEHFVWILAKDGHSVAKRVVTIGDGAGEKTVVGSGLAVGDRVVTVGVHSLVDGQAVAGEAGVGLIKAKGTSL